MFLFYQFIVVACFFRLDELSFRHRRSHLQSELNPCMHNVEKWSNFSMYVFVFFVFFLYFVTFQTDFQCMFDHFAALRMKG